MDLLLLFLAECLGAFEDFISVDGNRVDGNTQFIIPEFNFSCDGTVTQWKVGIEMDGGGPRPQSVNFQLWQSVGTGEYSLANEMDNESIAIFPVSMHVSDGRGHGWILCSWWTAATSHFT